MLAGICARLKLSQRCLRFRDLFCKFIEFCSISTAESSPILHVLIDVERFLISIFGGAPLGPAALRTERGVRISQLPIQHEGAVSLNFAGITHGGTTTSTPIDPSTAGNLPGGFSITGASLAFDLTTTAAYTAPITVCFNVPPVTGQTSTQFWP